MARRDGYSVHPVDEIRIPRFVRWRLRRARRGGRTGLLLHGVIRTPPRSMSRRQPVVSVWEGGRDLCMVSSHSKFPKWVELPRGRHVLRFTATRGMRSSDSEFSREVEIGPGQVLLAICEPIQPWTIFRASPSTDRWYIGMV